MCHRSWIDRTMYAWRAQNPGTLTILKVVKALAEFYNQSSMVFCLIMGQHLSLRSKYVSDLEELGILGRAIEANPEANLRFIVKNGNSIPAPWSLLFSYEFFSITFGKLRLLCEPFIARAKNGRNRCRLYFPQAGKRSSNLCR